jgi:hypothetical protein
MRSPSRRRGRTAPGLGREGGRGCSAQPADPATPPRNRGCAAAGWWPIRAGCRWWTSEWLQPASPRVGRASAAAPPPTSEVALVGEVAGVEPGAFTLLEIPRRRLMNPSNRKRPVRSKSRRQRCRWRPAGCGRWRRTSAPKVGAPQRRECRSRLQLARVGSISSDAWAWLPDRRQGRHLF